MSKYTYSISTDFPNGKVDADRLTLEIRESNDISKALDYIDVFVDEDYCNIYFKADLGTEEKTVLDNIVANHSGEPLKVPTAKKDSSDRLIVVPSPEKDKDMVIISSHDFCDPTTWFQTSERIYDDVLIEENGNIFYSDHEYWIDLDHGKYYQEDRIENKEDLYGVVVKVDGKVMQPRPPFEDDGGDYFVNYNTGRVHFNESQSGKFVTATYSYAVDSVFTVKPNPGKVLWVVSSEVQFAENVIMKDDVNFQGWAYNPSNPPEKIPVTKLTKYKTISDFVAEARGCYPVIPAIGGTHRGLNQRHVTFPFNYLQVKELKYSYGLEIRIWLTDDEHFDGEFGTATFYCVSYDEK